MTDLDVFRLSAKACGHEFFNIEDITSPKCVSTWPHIVYININDMAIEWNPFTDDSQRWECVKKLLETGWVVMGNQECNYDQMPASFKRMVYHCPPDEFPARALSELESRKVPK